MTEHSTRTPHAAEWDARYGGAERVWSGEPNGALVAEVAELRPGRALDVGCGEGADAVWLARRGWEVTALDVSRVALDRARAHADRAGVRVDWVHAGLVEADLRRGAFDLVSAQYAVLPRTPDAVAERTLLDLVAPGGTLLVVHHAIDQHAVDRPAVDDEHGQAHGAEHAGGHGGGHADAHAARHAADGGFDPALYALPADVAALLDADWHVEVDERRPRAVSDGGGTHHVEDLVLRAHRRGPSPAASAR